MKEKEKERESEREREREREREKEKEKRERERERESEREARRHQINKEENKPHKGQTCNQPDGRSIAFMEMLKDQTQKRIAQKQTNSTLARVPRNGNIELPLAKMFSFLSNEQLQNSQYNQEPSLG